MGIAMTDYFTAQDSNRVIVFVSGGKILKVWGRYFFFGLQRTAPIMFELVAENLDQKLASSPETA